MSITTCARALALTACLGLMVPGMALSAPYNDAASGVRAMTGAAKDMSDAKGTTAKSKQAKQAKAKKAPAKAAPAKKAQKQRPAPQDDSVRGG